MVHSSARDFPSSPNCEEDVQRQELGLGRSPTRSAAGAHEDTQDTRCFWIRSNVIRRNTRVQLNMFTQQVQTQLQPLVSLITGRVDVGVPINSIDNHNNTGATKPARYF